MTNRQGALWVGDWFQRLVIANPGYVGVTPVTGLRSGAMLGRVWIKSKESRAMLLSLKSAIALSVILFTAACVDRKSFETEPVVVQSARGTVVCQLYTRERVLWDRAIERPATMNMSEADDICRAEGRRLKAGG